MQTAALSAVAELAPSLSEAELRLLLELTRRGLDAPDFTFRASARHLAKACKISLQSVVTARDSLARRSFILCRSGTATRASAYRLSFLDTIASGVPSTGTPPFQPEEQGVLPTGTPLFQPEEQGVLPAGTPPADSMELFEHAPALDISIDSNTIFDRLAKTSPQQHDPAELEEAAHLLRHYKSKFGREAHCHPPDARIVAQLLTISPWPRLRQMLADLMTERRPAGDSYGWFVAVALQRIHGLSPQAQKAERARFKLVRSTPTGSPGEPAMNPGDLVNHLAKAKAL